MVMPKMIRAQPDDLEEDGGATQFERFDKLMRRLLKVPKNAVARGGQRKARKPKSKATSRSRVR